MSTDFQSKFLVSYFKAKDFCSNLGGEMSMDYPIETEYQIGNPSECGDEGNLWIPVIQGQSISEDDYAWVDDRHYNNKSVIQATNWADSQPNGYGLHQCVHIRNVSSGNYGWYDSDCQGLMCTVCRIPPAQHFTLRGPGLFKHHFWLALDFHWNSSKVVFEGEGNNKLKWYPMIERTELTSNEKDGNLSLWFDTNPLGGLQNFNNTWIFTYVSFKSHF